MKFTNTILQDSGAMGCCICQTTSTTNVFGGGGSGMMAGTPTGSDQEVRSFMQMLTLDAAKRLSYERDVTPTKETSLTTASAQ